MCLFKILCSQIRAPLDSLCPPFSRCSSLWLILSFVRTLGAYNKLDGEKSSTKFFKSLAGFLSNVCACLWAWGERALWPARYTLTHSLHFNHFSFHGYYYACSYYCIVQHTTLFRVRMPCNIVASRNILKPWKLIICRALLFVCVWKCLLLFLLGRSRSVGVSGFLLHSLRFHGCPFRCPSVVYDSLHSLERMQWTSHSYFVSCGLNRKEPPVLPESPGLHVSAAAHSVCCPWKSLCVYNIHICDWTHPQNWLNDYVLRRQGFNYEQKKENFESPLIRSLGVCVCVFGTVVLHRKLNEHCIYRMANKSTCFPFHIQNTRSNQWRWNSESESLNRKSHYNHASGLYHVAQCESVCALQTHNLHRPVSNCFSFHWALVSYFWSAITLHSARTPALQFCLDAIQ